MSSFIIIKIDDSKNAIKYLSNNSKKSVKTSRESNKKKKPKKININKFLTRELCFEHKKNYNIEHKRFQQILKEKYFLTEKPNLTSRSIENWKNSKKNPLFKRVIETLNLKKKRFLDLKRNNSIERSKIKEISKENIKNKYKKKNISLINIKKFCNKPKIKGETLLNKEEKQIDKNSNGNSNKKLINKLKNHFISKEKNNHEELSFGLYKPTNIMDFKKTYLENKYSYGFKPILNYSYKYRNISSKFNKIKNNQISKNNYHSCKNIISKDIKKIKNVRKDKDKKDSNNYKYNSNNNAFFENYIKNKKSKNKPLKRINSGLNQSQEIKNLSNLLKKVNNKKNSEIHDIKDNTYYLNINQSMAWNENVINNVIYKKNNKNINDIISKFK